MTAALVSPLLEPGDWTLPGAAPLHATRRNPLFRSEGARVGLVAMALGTPLMPWQQYAADVAGELNPDGSYRYPIVVVTVPRQSGKTTLLRAVGVDRGISCPGCGVFYTAQTGKDARERWQDLVTAIKASPLKNLATIRQAAGQERVIWPNGSMFRCFAPVATSLHGYTPPLVMLDEAFAHDEQTGEDLMGAIGPAQITIHRRQLWIVSTAGTAASVFLRKWVEAGRAGTPGVAILEWAAGPDVADIYDPAEWPTFHPAIGQTITVEAIAAEANRLSRAEFERAYGNRWTRTQSHLIPGDVWDRLKDPDQAPPTGRVVYAYDVAPDRQSAAIVAVWHHAGKVQAKVAMSGPGMGWVADAVETLRGAGRAVIGADDGGPAREVTDVLRRRGVEIVTLNAREFATAWGFLMQHIAHNTLRHDGSEVLALAAANVTTRPMSDASAPSRRNSAGDVSALVALMVGAFVLDHAAESPALDFRFAE